MSILDKVEIGNMVKVNLENSRDTLSKEIIDTLKKSPIGTISDFRITDGKSIGVILKLTNGAEQWFFENEIEILDENGNVMKQVIYTNEKNNLIYEIFKDLNYKNKKKVSDLINPLNFFLWLIVSFKDNF